MKIPEDFRKKSNPLYDRAKEGVVGYDIHYINAYKKKKSLARSKKKIKFEGLAA